MKKTRMLVVLVLLVLVPMGLVFAGGQSEEAPETVDEECFEGELDDRYCDRTGNLVADPPLDESQWQDPNTLVFSYAPTEDPAVYEEAFEDFVDYLSDVLDRDVRWFGVSSYAAQVEAMRANRLHISGFAAGAVQDAVNQAGFVPQTMMALPDGAVGYHMEVWAHKDSDIQTPEDLRGRELALVSESSNSGFFAPRAILYEEFDLLYGEDYQPAFSGSHDNSALGVLNQDYEAAAIADSVIDRMIDAGRLPAREEFARVIYTSQEFPSTAYGVAHDLHPDLQEQIREAFLNFEWEGTSLGEAFDPREQFSPIEYEEAWQVMRTVREGSNRVAEILGE